MTTKKTTTKKTTAEKTTAKKTTAKKTAPASTLAAEKLAAAHNAALVAEQVRVAELANAKTAAIARIDANLLEAGTVAGKGRNLIATIASDLPLVIAGFDGDAIKAWRKVAYFRIIAGALAIEPSAVEADWTNQKNWSQPWKDAHGNARSIMTQAFGKAGLDGKTGLPKVEKPRGANETAPKSDDKTSPVNVKDVLKTAPVADLIEYLASLSPATFAAIVGDASLEQYRTCAPRGGDLDDLHFCEAVMKANGEYAIAKRKAEKVAAAV